MPESSKFHGNSVEEGKSFENSEVTSVISYDKIETPLDFTHYWYHVVIIIFSSRLIKKKCSDYFYTHCPCSLVSIWVRITSVT